MKLLKLAFLGILLSVNAFILFPMLPVTYHLQVGDIDHDSKWNMKLNALVLKFADDNDTVKVHIDSVGGYVVYTIPVINAMIHSDAHVISINEGVAYSAGGYIAMAADEIQANSITTYLFHRPFILDALGHKRALPDNSPIIITTNDFMRKYVFKYLTVAEVEAYNKGYDIILTGDQLIARIKFIDSIIGENHAG